MNIPQMILMCNWKLDRYYVSQGMEGKICGYVTIIRYKTTKKIDDFPSLKQWEKLHTDLLVKHQTLINNQMKSNR